MDFDPNQKMTELPIKEDTECCKTLLQAQEADKLISIVASIITSPDVSTVATDAFPGIHHIVSKYQEQAQLLDPILEELIAPLSKILLEHEVRTVAPVGRILWQIAVVRSPKVISRFFPSEAACLEPVMAMLQEISSIETDRPWELQWVLLLWLSVLVMIPFHFSIIDSNLAFSTAADVDCPPIVQSIVGLCKKQLFDASSCREMAARVLGKLLSRHDMVAALMDFKGRGLESLETTDTNSSAFVVPGTALAFATLFKLGKREPLLETALHVLPIVTDLLTSKSFSSNALSRKLMIKLVQRIGLIFLRPRMASWRYEKGKKTLLSSDQPNFTRSIDSEDGALIDLHEHTEAIETVIEALLVGLADRDTIVRWSAAKGLGRVTGRLPKDFADEVVASVLEAFFSPSATDTAWHGGCLAVAELARRGLLLPTRLPEVTPLLLKALVYDVRKGACSVGAHVRDAAAYVCWALARAYSPRVIGDAAAELGPCLIALAVYDREVNCRRAAAAAFQECVGRLNTFPHGIEVLTAADYFTVSIRAHAYLKVALQVGAFEEYLEPLTWHLSRIKLRHWEKSLRELAAEGLAALVHHNPPLFAHAVLPYLVPLCTDSNLDIRHGAIAAVAELMPAVILTACSNVVTEDRYDIANILPAVQKARLEKGKGGEVMRGALCRLAETTCAVGIPLTENGEAKETILALIYDNLKHPSADIQKAAAAALSAYALRHLPVPTDAVLTSTVDVFIKELLLPGRTSSPFARRGAALALKALPTPLIEAKLPDVVDALVEAATLESEIERRDVETRVNAVDALCQIVLSAKEYQEQAIATFQAALEDYSSDNRGDIGSWVREAAMRSMTAVLLSRQHEEEIIVTAVSSMLKQAVERLGRLRACAIRCCVSLLPLLNNDDNLQSDLIEALPKNTMQSDAVSDADVIPPLVVTLLGRKSLQVPLLEGLIPSIGGLDPHLSKMSADALVEAIQIVSKEDMYAFLDSFLHIWQKCSRVQRMSTPLLVTAELLLSRTPIRSVENPDFLMRIMSAAYQESKGSTDIAKLHAASGVFSQLIWGRHGQVRKEATLRLLALLGSKYPKVRRYTAEQFYTVLLMVDAVDDLEMEYETVEYAGELLSQIAWDGEMEGVRLARKRLYSLFGLCTPIVLTTARPEDIETVTAQEQGYQSLVDSAARDA